MDVKNLTTTVSPTVVTTELPCSDLLDPRYFYTLLLMFFVMSAITWVLAIKYFNAIRRERNVWGGYERI